jgi:hypothetical protein
MTTSSHPTEPLLDAPGAGIPAIERFVGGLMFGFRRRFSSPAQISAKFQAEREVLRKLYLNVDPNARGTRVLIPRLRGLEDSSRYWSVWMVLDHLRIVNTGITNIITLLAQERTPERVVSTAAVKPDPQVTEAVEAAYEQSCDDYLATVVTIKTFKTKTRHAHPWFGPLDAAGWHSMVCGHMGIHRAQMAKIIQRLP